MSTNDTFYIDFTVEEQKISITPKHVITLPARHERKTFNIVRRSSTDVVGVAPDWHRWDDPRAQVDSKGYAVRSMWIDGERVVCRDTEYVNRYADDLAGAAVIQATVDVKSRTVDFVQDLPMCNYRYWQLTKFKEGGFEVPIKAILRNVSPRSRLVCTVHELRL
jgi:hypothetical protein